MKKKNIVAIIQARMGSTRLPGKVLMNIGGKPMLWHVIERIKKCKNIDSIIVATTSKKENNPIIELARKCRVEIFIGSENDVLDRYYQTAKKFKADVIVRITSDCPLINPTTIDNMIDLYLKKNADYVCGHPNFPSIEHGMEVISFSALKKVKNMAVKDYQKEHVTIYIKENPELFKISVIKPELIFQREDMRLTVDTKEDFQLMKEIYNRLYKENEIIDIKDVIELLINNQSLKEMNFDIKMSSINKYAHSQKIKKKLLKSLINRKNHQR